jgi:hypothetical protein
MTFATCTFSTVALALMGVIAAELATEAGTQQSVPDAAPQLLLPASSPPQERLEQQEQGVTRAMNAVARPLFSPDRRPPSPDAAPAVVASNTLPRLAGTLVIPGRKQAVFETGSKDAGSKPAVVGEGDRVDAWTVEAISPGRVTLAGPDGPRVLHVGFTRDGRVQEAQAVQLPVTFRPLRTHNRVNAAARS